MAVLATLWLSVGCQAILGIEERSLDVEELSERGYEGCEPGRGICNACTSLWHRCICEGWDSRPEAELRLQCAEEHAPEAIREEAIQRAEAQYEEYQAQLREAGADTDDETEESDEEDTDENVETEESNEEESEAETDDTDGLNAFEVLCQVGDIEDPVEDACFACMCESCVPELSECAEDEQCEHILSCLDDHDCTPIAMVGPDSCYRPEFCGPVIDAIGGVQGEAHQLFRQGIDCLTANACPCGEDGGGGETFECWPEAGCDCRNCWDACLCQGQSDNRCFDQCASPACTGADGCSNCGDCVDTCMCNGFDLHYCMDLCGPDDSCRPERGCVCGDCMEDCECNGNNKATCEGFCGVDRCQPSEGCLCGDCYSDCLCEFNDPAACDASCRGDLCNPIDSCQCGGSCHDQCYCEGNDFDTCFDRCEGDSCSPQAGCYCGSCYADCMCFNLGADACDLNCYPDPCTPEGGCFCDSCEEECQCWGNNATFCQNSCNIQDCSEDGGCFCDDCYSTCYCQGKTTAECDDECAAEPCSAAGGCVCNTCQETCSCQGNTDSICTTQCTEPCSAADSCIDCTDCQSQCECEGGGPIECQTLCHEGEFLDCANHDACDGCFTCAGQCSCGGGSAGNFSDCAIECAVSDCAAGDCNLCQSCQANCECEGGSPEECLELCVGMTCEEVTLGDECEQCACDNCLTQYRICDETSGCLDLLRCMTDWGCPNIQECYSPALCETQIYQAGGLDSPNMQVVEALQACRVNSGCPCYEGTQTQPVACGSGTCDPFVPPPPDPIAPACCFAEATQECGLEADPVFGLGWGCQPIKQPGYETTQCPSTFPTFAPYAGYEIVGCCRPTGECGFWEDRMGLDCVPPEMFGEYTSITCNPDPGADAGIMSNDSGP